MSSTDAGSRGMSAPVTIRSSRIDEAREVGGRVYHPHQLHVGGAEKDFQMRLRAATVGALTVGFLEYATPVGIRTDELESSYQVNFPLRGHLVLTCDRHRVASSPTLAAVHGPGLTTSLEGWRVPTTMLGLKIPQSTVQAELATLLGQDAASPPAFEGEMFLDGPGGHEWRTAVDLLAMGVREDASLLSNPLIAVPAAQAVVRGLLLLAPNSFSARLLADAKSVDSGTVRRAVQFMDAHARDPLTLETVSAHVGVGPRALQLGFQRSLSLTPMAYLRGRRLHGARARLQRGTAEDTVAAVAAEWGFAHPGRFAVQYAKSFGQHPSETLAASPFRGLR